MVAKDAKEGKGSGSKQKARSKPKGQASNKGPGEDVMQATTPSIWLMCNFGFDSNMADTIVGMWGDGKWCFAESDKLIDLAMHSKLTF